MDILNNIELIDGEVRSGMRNGVERLFNYIYGDKFDTLTENEAQLGLFAVRLVASLFAIYIFNKFIVEQGYTQIAKRYMAYAGIAIFVYIMLRLYAVIEKPLI